jgi:hypothetical protein
MRPANVQHRIEKGASIFIPKNTLHGVENADSELFLLWMVAPPGLESLFREIATRPGTSPIRRTKKEKKELNEITRKYETEFR